MDASVRQAVAAAEHVSGQGWVDAVRRVAAEGFKVVDGVVVDQFSASAMIQVHDALSEANRAKFAAMPVAQAHAITFRIIAKQAT